MSPGVAERLYKVKFDPATLAMGRPADPDVWDVLAVTRWAGLARTGGLKFEGDAEPALTRLGTQDWERAKRKARQAVQELATELLELYAKRQLSQGYAFSPDGEWQHELEDTFPYDETPDQLRAIADVKHDMEQIQPMDRLICGDVGYGKTEVAIRAAFKAVMGGRQVAILVPTTVLARQHWENIRQRMSEFPVTLPGASNDNTLMWAHPHQVEPAALDQLPGGLLTTALVLTKNDSGNTLLHEAAEPRRQELFRRINLGPTGTRLLVSMREEMLATLKDNPALAAAPISAFSTRFRNLSFSAFQHLPPHAQLQSQPPRPTRSRIPPTFF